MRCVNVEVLKSTFKISERLANQIRHLVSTVDNPSNRQLFVSAVERFAPRTFYTNELITPSVFEFNRTRVTIMTAAIAEILGATIHRQNKMARREYVYVTNQNGVLQHLIGSDRVVISKPEVSPAKPADFSLTWNE